MTPACTNNPARNTCLQRMDKNAHIYNKVNIAR